MAWYLEGWHEIKTSYLCSMFIIWQRSRGTDQKWKMVATIPRWRYQSPPGHLVTWPKSILFTNKMFPSPRALFRYINDSNMQTFRINFIRNNETQNLRTQESLQKYDLVRFSNTKENLSKINLSSFSFWYSIRAKKTMHHPKNDSKVKTLN